MREKPREESLKEAADPQCQVSQESREETGVGVSSLITTSLVIRESQATLVRAVERRRIVRLKMEMVRRKSEG